MTNKERVDRFCDLVAGDPEIGPLAAPMLAGAQMAPDTTAALLDRIGAYWRNVSERTESTDPS